MEKLIIYLTFGFCNIFTWKFISRKGIQLGNSSLWLYIHNFTCSSMKNSCCLNLQEIFELGRLLLISEITQLLVWHRLTTVYKKSRSFAISIHSEWFWGSWKGARVFAQNVLLPVWHFAHLNVVFAPARNFPVWVLSWKTVAVSFGGIIWHLHCMVIEVKKPHFGIFYALINRHYALINRHTFFWKWKGTCIWRARSIYIVICVTGVLGLPLMPKLKRRSAINRWVGSYFT